jgi:hypothetical protein
MLRIVLTFALLLTLAACAGQNRFVLLEEEDGSVGAITVQNQGGSQTIEPVRPRRSAKRRSSRPGAPPCRPAR